MKNILIIEDDFLNAKLLEKALPKFGDFSTIVEENVEKILKIMENGKIDIIILDISLANSTYQGKKVDGVDIARLIKEIPGKSDIPIIILTAYAMNGDDKDLLMETKADYYFAKPLADISILAEKIKELLEE